VYDDAKTVLTVASSQQRASGGVEAAPSSECAKRIPLLRSPARSSLDVRIAISSSTYRHTRTWTAYIRAQLSDNDQHCTFALD
jgi:hypothetical protein